MNREFKIKLSNFCNTLIIFMIGLTILWFIGYFIIQSFELSVFRQKTTESLFLFLFVTVVIVACCAILSVSLNISIIAESKIQEDGQVSSMQFGRKALGYLLIIILGLVAFLFISDYFSRHKKKDIILNQSNELIQKNKVIIDNILLGISDTSKAINIEKNLRILNTQSEDLPESMIIIQREFQGKKVFLQLDNYEGKIDLFKKGKYSSYLYKVKKEDKEYLENVFNNKNSESLFYMKNEDYYVYVPISKGKEIVVLKFLKEDFGRYGKIGSR